MLKFLGLSNGTPSDKEVPAWNGVEKKHKALSIAGRLQSPEPAKSS